MVAKAFLSILLIMLALTGRAVADEGVEVLFATRVAFSSQNGTPIVAPAGLYRVESDADKFLRLSSLTGGPTLSVPTTISKHNEDIQAPFAIYQIGQKGFHHVLLLLPGGKLLAAVGASGYIPPARETPAITLDKISMKFWQGYVRNERRDLPFSRFLPTNEIVRVRVLEDTWDRQVLQVKYRFEVGGTCTGVRAVITAKPVVGNYLDLYSATSSTIEIHDPILPPNPFTGNWVRTSLAQAQATWVDSLPSVDLTLRYNGFSYSQTTCWKITMSCETEQGQLLAEYQRQSQKWWAFNPPIDADFDGIPDAAEDVLALKYAPEVRLAPSSEDWTRPANVDWYLTKVHMRFNHSSRCSDCQILDVGEVTQSNMHQQSHRRKNSTCTHTGDPRYSRDATAFFLQPPNHDVHKGISDSGNWRVYAHVSPTSAGGYRVQYWFFYPYNDGWGAFNHEGDWEHISVILDYKGELVSADPGNSNPYGLYYAKHDRGTRYAGNEVTWVYGTHPVVYSADGSHASYPCVGAFSIVEFHPSSISAGLGILDHTYDGGPVWQTWRNLVNVGETGSPLNGQEFILYGGRWGEIGETDITTITTGPRSPSFQESFNREDR